LEVTRHPGGRHEHFRKYRVGHFRIETRSAKSANDNDNNSIRWRIANNTIGGLARCKSGSPRGRFGTGGTADIALGA
jgi:hypothetical protein